MPTTCPFIIVNFAVLSSAKTTHVEIKTIFFWAPEDKIICGYENILHL